MPHLIPGTPDQLLHRRELVTALRTGNFTQGRGQLRDGADTYCCLGVACEISGLGVWEPSNGAYFFVPAAGLADRVCLPIEVQDWLGFDHHDGQVPVPVQANDDTYPSLATVNDSGEFTFAQIADLIEATWECAPEVLA